MNTKQAIKKIVFPIAIAAGLGILSSCYEVKIEVIAPYEGIRIPNLSDGTYSSGDKKPLIKKIRWDASSREYSVESVGEKTSTFSRVRVLPLYGNYMLAQYTDAEGIAIFIAAVTAGEIVIYESPDRATEARLSAKNGVVVQGDEFGPYITSTNANAIRAFMRDLSASGTLKPTLIYRYTGP